MISKEDLRQYLDDVKALEMRMETLYKDITDQVEDAHIQEVCSQLAIDEKKHIEQVLGLISILGV